LEVGGFNIQLYNYVPEIIDMIISVIIYCGAFALLFKQIIKLLITKPVIDTDHKDNEGVPILISGADKAFVPDEANDITRQEEVEK